jgi:hypothetical protein
MSQDPQRIADLVEIEQLCARYLAYASQFVPDQWLKVFTPDAEYSAFGSVYDVERMPALLAAAPRGQFIGSMPVVDFDGDRATGTHGLPDRATGMQHFVFIDQKTHAMRLAWYRDEYVRTAEGWRIRRRSTTFMRKSGGYDSGVQHDPLADAAKT